MGNPCPEAIPKTANMPPRSDSLTLRDLRRKKSEQIEEFPLLSIYKEMHTYGNYANHGLKNEAAKPCDESNAAVDQIEKPELKSADGVVLRRERYAKSKESQCNSPPSSSPPTDIENELQIDEDMREAFIKCRRSRGPKLSLDSAIPRLEMANTYIKRRNRKREQTKENNNKNNDGNAANTTSNIDDNNKNENNDGDTTDVNSENNSNITKKNGVDRRLKNKPVDKWVKRESWSSNRRWSMELLSRQPTQGILRMAPSRSLRLLANKSSDDSDSDSESEIRVQKSRKRISWAENLEIRHEFGLEKKVDMFFA